MKFDFGGIIQELEGATGTAPVQTWRRLQVQYTPTNSIQRADDQFFTIDIANYTNGQIDPTWNSADYSTVAGALSHFLIAIAPQLSSEWTATELRYYVMAFHAYTYSEGSGSNLRFPPFVKSGAPEFVSPTDVPGGNPGFMGPQVSSTITEMTPSRKHWGRLYLPALATVAFTSQARLAIATVDALCSAYEALVLELASHQFFICIPTTMNNGTPLRALQFITGVEVDDVSDVIRRRRWRDPQYKKQLP